MTARAIRSRYGTAGFTLVEMLVTLVLLALLATYLPQAYRIVRQTWLASAALNEETSEQNARIFIAARLAEAMPLFERKSGGDEVAFSGKGDELTFVALSPRGPAGSGIYRFRLYRGSDGKGTGALLVAIWPYDTGTAPDSAADDKPAPDVHSLMSGVSSFDVRYFGRPAPRERPVWQAAWTRVDALPDLVELTVRRAGAAPSPPQVVELRLRSGQ